MTQSERIFTRWALAFCPFFLALFVVTVPALAQGSWTTKAPTPTGRFSLAVGVVNGTVYAVGGYNGTTVVGTNEAYDPATDTWAAKASLPSARELSSTNAAVANGILYVVGGTPPGFCTNEADAYNPATNTWTVLAPMSTPRCWLTVVALNGLVYAIGGTNTSGNIKYSTMEVYNPTTNSWSPGPNMITGRQQAGGAVINGKIYIVGGWAGPTGVDQSDTHNTRGGYLTNNEVYDPIANSWTTVAPMPTLRGSFGTGVINGMLFAVGGANDSGALSTVEAYNPAINNWTAQTPDPIARNLLSSTVVNGLLYAVGGLNGTGSPVATNEAFTPQAATGTTISSSPNPAVAGQPVTFTAAVSPLPPGSGTPTGSVTFTDGATTLGSAALSGGQATFTTSWLSVGSHSITAQYSGDANFSPSTGSLSQNVTYGVCPLYDQTRSVNSGAVYPIKVALCNANGTDVSSSAVVLHATAVTKVSGFVGTPESAGSANPDNDFRFDGTLGTTGGYIFNLSTSGLASGTYSLQFTAAGDPVTHSVNFGVK